MKKLLCGCAALLSLVLAPLSHAQTLQDLAHIYSGLSPSQKRIAQEALENYLITFTVVDDNGDSHDITSASPQWPTLREALLYCYAGTGNYIFQGHIVTVDRAAQETRACLEKSIARNPLGDLDGVQVHMEPRY